MPGDLPGLRTEPKSSCLRLGSEASRRSLGRPEKFIAPVTASGRLKGILSCPIRNEDTPNDAPPTAALTTRCVPQAWLSAPIATNLSYRTAPAPTAASTSAAQLSE